MPRLHGYRERPGASDIVVSDAVCVRATPDPPAPSWTWPLSWLSWTLDRKTVDLPERVPRALRSESSRLPRAVVVRRRRGRFRLLPGGTKLLFSST